ncbi:microtubule-associated tumor suppressor candidate 2 isoform 2-T2 [Pelodytes ibericus]
MSTTLVPGKPCCTEQNNSNEDKNDNETGTSLGDPNANQIFSTTKSPEQVEVCSSVEKTGLMCTWKSETFTQLSKEHSSSLHHGRESPSRGLVLSDHSTSSKELSRGHMTDDAKDGLKVSVAHGQTQFHSKTSSHDRCSLIPINRASESSFSIYSNNAGNISPCERFKGLSLVKSGIASTKSESFVRDNISPIPLTDSPSKYFQCMETANFGVRTTDASPPVDRLFGLPSHTLNNTSEEKKIVFYAKSPTSDASVSEFHTGEKTILHTNKESTLPHLTSTDHYSRFTPKPQVICSISEAQEYQGQTGIASELTDARCPQSKGTGTPRTEHDLARLKRGEHIAETRVAPFFPHSASVTWLPSNRAVKQAESLLCSSPTLLDANHSILRQNEYASLKHKEPINKPAIRKTTSVNGSLDNKMQLYKDRVSVEDYLYQGNNTHSFSGGNATSLKDKTALAEGKKTVVGRKHQTDVLKGSMKESQRDSADTLMCSPTPLSPVAAVNINDQRIASPNSCKDLSAVNADRLSPSSALPPIESTQMFDISPKATNKTLCNSGIPKPILIHSKNSLITQGDAENNYNERVEEPVEQSLIVPKPKHVRPKIITYIRRNPQAVDRLPFGQMSMPFVAPSCTVPIPKEHELLSSDMKTSNVLLDKYKADLQKPRIFSAGLMVSGIQTPGHHSLDEAGERPRKDDFCSSTFSHYEVPPSYYRSTMILKPQLGLGAISRLPSAKNRILIASQRLSSGSITQQEQARVPGSANNTDASEDLKKDSITNGAKSNLPKPCQSGLRPPGYSRLPAGKLAAFGFVRSSSVSSLSSNQSNESIQSDHSRPLSAGTSFANEEQSTPKIVLPSRDIPKGTSRTVLQVCSSTTVPRRSLLPSPKTSISPAGSKKETQKDHEVIKTTVSSPKKQATSTTKLHSPGHPKLRPTISKNGYAGKTEPQSREADRQSVHKLKEKYEEQSKKLLLVQEELKKASCGFVVFAVTTQYFFKKIESCLVKEKELSDKLSTIRDEAAIITLRCEKLQKEKEELEIKFDHELRKLEHQQQEELQALKDRLQAQHNEEIEKLLKQQSIKLIRIRSHHQEQIVDLAAVHEATLEEINRNHSTANNSMHDDHERRTHELRERHEYEKKVLEDNFEKLRLSLQDQVDTLTIQNHSLRDRAKRFEEALSKNTNEQFEFALAPYRHLDLDLTSAKQVLEMKNQVIHQQEKRIMELEKLAEINVILEEKNKVLQQQNEDMQARIDKNVTMTRQLSAECANLHQSVEKESNEKKRLSRTNEELVWKLQTAETISPTKLPNSSINRSASGSSPAAKVSPIPR